jgi:hypothetical protein
LASGNGCTHIVIPAGTCLDVCNPPQGGPAIAISSSHNNLRLTINGILRYVGVAAEDMHLIQINGASNVTIDHDVAIPDAPGLITSIHVPCVLDGDDLGCDCEQPIGGKCDIANGIRIFGGQNITIRDLEFRRLTTMVLQEGVTTDIDLINLTAGGNPVMDNGMAQYGVYLSDTNGATITDCVVNGAYLEHCYRSYASNLTVTDCEGYRRQAGGTGIWLVEGCDVSVDGLITDNRAFFGPNPACMDDPPSDDWADDGERLRFASLANIDADGDFLVELGTQGLYVSGLSCNNFGIGRVPAGSDGWVPRPLNRVHWGTVTPTPVPSNVANTICIGFDIGPCVADVDDNGIVDVDDLVAVILGWGNCSASPWGDCDEVDPTEPPLLGTCENLTPCTRPVTHCPADIVPYHKGNNVVDADDLTEVILSWGCSWTSGGNMNNAPQTVQDCWNKCAELHGTGNTLFEECNQKCIDSLYQRGLLP